MTPDELMVKAETILDNYEKTNGILEFRIYDVDEVSKYFHLKIEQLNKLSAIECAEVSYLLAQYSFYLQRMYNRESAKNRWAQDQITKIVCDKLDSYNNGTYMKYDHKISIIAKENKVVEKLQSILNYTSQIMERMNFLSTSVKNMSEIMSNLQKAKFFKGNQ